MANQPILIGIAGTNPGSKHVNVNLRGQSDFFATTLHNNQDAYGIDWTTHNLPFKVPTIVVCDGSSGARHSEIGAGLIARLGSAKLSTIINEYGTDDPEFIGNLFYSWIIKTLESLVELHPLGDHYLNQLHLTRVNPDFIMDFENDLKLQAVRTWILRNLLFTTIAAHFGVDKTTVLRRGDGGCVVDDVLLTANYNDIPPYPAYALLPEHDMNKAIAEMEAETQKTVITPPPGFQVDQFNDATTISVFSDGLPIDLLDQVWSLMIPPERWGIGRDILALTMRRWWRENSLELPGSPPVGDDVTVVSFARVEEN